MNTDAIRTAFAQAFGRPAQGAVRAPGRVNLIGEHTDYNDGFVLPIAINRQTLGAWAARDDGRIAFRSVQQEAGGELDLAQPVQPAEPRWANYCRGVVAGLLNAGVKLRGCDVLFDSDVPLGGGLSSSASLEVATALAVLSAAGRVGAVEGHALAKICQTAEHEFAGAPCGIMDQSIAILGKAGHALLLDCRSGETRHVPFDDPGLVLLVADTQVKHAISDGGYAARRDQCHSSARKLGVAALRDVDAPAVADAAKAGKLDEKELMRARHVVGEIRRTLDACRALEARDYDGFGRLMYSSHESLRDDYEVSCEELDAIVEIGRGLKGVHGARMTGGGFGGCAILLVDASRVDAVADAVADGFEKRFARRCPVFATRAADGASVL